MIQVERSLQPTMFENRNDVLMSAIFTDRLNDSSFIVDVFFRDPMG
jgi:hypothetical protein